MGIDDTNEIEVNLLAHELREDGHTHAAHLLLEQHRALKSCGEGLKNLLEQSNHWMTRAHTLENDLSVAISERQAKERAERWYGRIEGALVTIAIIVIGIGIYTNGG